MILKLSYSREFFLLCIVVFILTENFGHFKRGYTGRNFEGRTLRFLHLVAYLNLYKKTIFRISNLFQKILRKKRNFGNFLKSTGKAQKFQIKKKLSNFYVGINKLPNAKKKQCSTFKIET